MNDDQLLACCNFDASADVEIGQMLSEISVPTYVELIVVTKYEGTTDLVYPETCARQCNHVRGFTIQRELFDPSKYVDVKALTLVMRVDRTAYTPYLRNFNTNQLSDADYAMALTSRMSVVLLDVDFTPGQITAVLNHLSSSREILPMRVVR